jgi:hypothetical protein
VAEKYTSKVALVLREPVPDVGAVVGAAREARDIDRAAAVRGEGHEAQEVHWGGRMQKAVVRQVEDEAEGSTLLRIETYVGGDGLKVGMQRQAQLLQALSRQLGAQVTGVRDISALADRDQAWVNRLAIGAVEHDDAVATIAEGEGTWWARTHGAARFDVPDLELYGLKRGQVGAAETALRHVHDQLLARGLKTELELPDGTPVYLVPVLEAWHHVPLEWPGVGKAGVERGPGLDGPRASLSVRHRPRLGRWKTDLKGVLKALETEPA